MEPQNTHQDNVLSRVELDLQDGPARYLWERLRQELNRPQGGIDACQALLESELVRLTQSVQASLKLIGPLGG